MDELLDGLGASLDDSGKATGEVLHRLAVAGRGLWDVLGTLARRGAAGCVTLETTLGELVRLLPPDARAALGAVGDPGDPLPLTVTYELAERVARVHCP